MGPLEQILHTFNFILPAWFLAGLCVGSARLLARLGLPRALWRWTIQWLVQGVLGSAVLIGGLLVFGADGKMTTYAVLVFWIATVQWLMCRGWRRAG
jgi:hypothetical protein